MADSTGSRGDGPRTVKPETGSPGKSASAFRTISEVATDIDVPPHVLRFWESKFAQVKPLKRGGGRRYYRPEDVALLRGIRDLLYTDGYTIKGVQKLLRESGVKAIANPASASESPAPDDSASALPSQKAGDMPMAASAKPAATGELGAGHRAALAEVLSDLQKMRERLAS